PPEEAPVVPVPPRPANGPTMISVQELKTHFPLESGFVFKKQTGTVKAVDGVSFEVRQGEVLGLVGESGSGKSTLARTIMQLIPPSAGTVILGGKNLTQGSTDELKAARRD